MVERYKSLDSSKHIHGWYIDPEVCRDMVQLFEDNSQFHHPGYIGPEVDITRKHSTDMTISRHVNDSVLSKYLNELEKCVEDYKVQHPELNRFGPWGITEDFLIQRYQPNEGYFQWHSERGTISTANRMLVFMTYLNTVTDDGETEFMYQHTKVKPEEGLTLIWPTDFTHLHRGITSKTQVKYITTGWYSFK